MDKRIIDTAIAAHNLWKSRLEEAIRTGKLDIPIDKIILDYECVFGKWLYSHSISIDQKSSHYYKKVKKLHAEFHSIAAKVAELASTGKTAEAEDLMAISGAFAVISGKLNVPMVQWAENSTLVKEIDPAAWTASKIDPPEFSVHQLTQVSTWTTYYPYC